MPRTDLDQEKRLTRLVNKARALADMYSQASLIIPLSVPPRLPSSVSLDRTSPWHVSALFNAAFESASLFTRLRTSDQVNSTSLGNVTDLLNVFGKQTIASLQVSIVEPAKPASNGTNGAGMQLPSGRGELYDRLSALGYVEEQEQQSSDDDDEGGNNVKLLDVDLSTLDESINASAGARRRGRRARVFSQMTTARGEDALKSRGGAGNQDGSDNEGRRRGQERPKTHR